MEANNFSSDDDFSPTMSQTRSTVGFNTPNMSACFTKSLDAQPVLGLNL